MSARLGHRLFVQIRPGYAFRLERLREKLSGYRVERHIDWNLRVEAWLSNFDGLTDQEIALSLLERLRVVSHDEVVAGCRALLESIQVGLPENARPSRSACRNSGASLD